MLPVVKGLAARSREVETASKEGWKYKTINDSVDHYRIYIVRGDPAIPDPGSGGCIYDTITGIFMSADMRDLEDECAFQVSTLFELRRNIFFSLLWSYV